eukprot:Opistho-2@42860
MEDPFFEVRDDVQKSISTAQELYDRWQELLSDNTTASKNEELDWVARELRTVLKTVELDLDDLDEVIKISESDPEKFDLTRSEIDDRKAFVARTRRTLNDIRDHMANSGNRVKVQQRGELLGGKAGGSGTGSKAAGKKADKYAKAQEETRKQNQTFIDDQKQLQEQIIRQQDHELDQISTSLSRTKEISLKIGDELDAQDELINDLDQHMDNTGSRLKQVIAKVDKVMRSSNDGKQMCCIVVLLIILVVVIVLVVEI